MMKMKMRDSELGHS